VELNSREYLERRKTEPVTFIIKKGFGAHRASGLELFTTDAELNLIKRYKSGSKCGYIKEPNLAQYYVSNPLLLDKNNKFDFRIYMLIASVNPLIAFYHDGFLRVSLKEYDKNSKDVMRITFFNYSLRFILPTLTYLKLLLNKLTKLPGNFLA
jgi:hypothetical protein